MNHTYLLAVAFTCLTAITFGAPMSEKEIGAAVNKVLSRVAGGDIESLAELKTLPYDSAVPALFIFYRQNHVVLRETAQNRLIAAKAAQLISEVPDAGLYFKDLFKKQKPGVKIPNWMADQRITAVACLVQLHNVFAIRTAAESLVDPDLGIEPSTLAMALADMNIPRAPYSRGTRKEAATPEGIAKWKEWWHAQEGAYADEPK